MIPSEPVIRPESKRKLRRLFRLFLAACMLTGTPAILASCNTTEGVGRDVESAGENLQDAAQDARD